MPFIPLGNAQNKLKEKGRIVSVQLTRSMSSGNVKQVITRAYPWSNTDWLYLETNQDNRLVKAKEQCRDGNAICTRRGALYIVDEQVTTTANLPCLHSGNWFGGELCIGGVFFLWYIRNKRCLQVVLVLVLLPPYLKENQQMQRYTSTLSSTK